MESRSVCNCPSFAPIIPLGSSERSLVILLELFVLFLLPLFFLGFFNRYRSIELTCECLGKVVGDRRKCSSTFGSGGGAGGWRTIYGGNGTLFTTRELYK